MHSPRGQPTWTRRWRSVAPVVALATSLGIATSACGDEVTGSTSQQRVTLQTRVDAPAEAKTSFVNGYGWTVTLQKATLALGPLYFFEGEPVLVRRRVRRRTLWAQLYDWFVPDASAHPGHYQSGNAMGQMLDSTSVDLLSTPTTLPAGDGVTGTFRSATFFFASPTSGGATAVVGGSASKDEVTLTFHASVQLDELLNYEQKPAVIGCAFDPYADVTGDTTITVTVDPRLWLDQVDFAELQPPADGSEVELSPETIAHKALVRGMKKGGGYRFSVTTSQTTN